MHKKTKIFISFFIIFIISILFQFNFAKYIMEDIHTVAKLDIDRCEPTIELMDIVSSNEDYPNYANKTHFIIGHIKITEKNIIRNDLSPDNIKITVANSIITPEFKNFSLQSENATEKIYEFSFTNVTADGSLAIVIPGGIVEDKSGLVNKEQNLSTHILIDNTPPIATFTEIATLDGKAKAEIIANESIRPINAWESSEKNMVLSKEFSNSISYFLPITDFSQNTSEVWINIQNATHILLQYGCFVSHSKQNLVSNGKISSLDTTSSHSIYAKLSGHSNSALQGKNSIYSNSKNGYNFTSISKWIQSRLKNPSDFSIIYQVYTNDTGWLKAICDTQENSSQQSKSISAFRINLVPITEKEYFINFWNRDIGTNHMN